MIYNPTITPPEVLQSLNLLPKVWENNAEYRDAWDNKYLQFYVDIEKEANCRFDDNIKPPIMIPIDYSKVIFFRKVKQPKIKPKFNTLYLRDCNKDFNKRTSDRKKFNDRLLKKHGYTIETLWNKGNPYYQLRYADNNTKYFGPAILIKGNIWTLHAYDVTLFMREQRLWYQKVKVNKNGKSLLQVRIDEDKTIRTIKKHRTKQTRQDLEDIKSTLG